MPSIVQPVPQLEDGRDVTRQEPAAQADAARRGIAGRVDAKVGEKLLLHLGRRPHVRRDPVQGLVRNGGQDAFAVIHRSRLFICRGEVL